jgi:hypothetical protein
MAVDKLRKALPFLVLATVPLASQAAFAQTPTVTVSVMQGGTTASYRAPWYPGMSVLNALEQALPAAQGGVSLSLKYLPSYGGYAVDAVAGIATSHEGIAKFWRTCLLPAGPGNNTILLPLFANKILVGSGDTVILAYDQECPGTLPQK